MPEESEVKLAIKNGLAYIGSQQLPDGSLPSFSSPSAVPFRQVLAYNTNFAPSLVLSSLSGLKMPAAQRICGRLAKFLLAQKSPAWSFNYWVSGAQQRETQPYPDDLDDTFCALSSLFLYDRRIITEEALAKAVRLLLATEASVGGPYRTWLVPAGSPEAWLDVDLAVNSNIAFFLSLVSNPLPNLEIFIDRAITAGSLSSPYYPSAYPLVYYIARAYKGQHKNKLLKMIRKLQAAKTITSLDQALCLAALVYLGETHSLDMAAAGLLESQHKNGSWPAAAFCNDPSKGKQAYYNGAPALTTAFVIEALELYRHAVLLPIAADAKPKTAVKRAKKIEAAVLAMAGGQCQELAADLRASTLGELNKLAGSGNGPEIINLAYKFNRSLAEPFVPRANNFFETLGLANLYGWSAYTIYDDFLDEEGRPELLSSANFAMRGSLSCFADALPDHLPFRELILQTFNTIDGANAWELSNCRFACTDGQLVVSKPLPAYGDLAKLAERSLGHTLTPLAVLLARGFSIDSTAFKQTQQALKHYLIARQLNDDAHDWQTDLQNGHITYVVRSILSEGRVKPGTYALGDLLPAMQRQFWYHTLGSICREIERQARLSRQAISLGAVMQPSNVITKMLDGIEASTRDARSTQAEASNFLKHYRQKAFRQ